MSHVFAIENVLYGGGGGGGMREVKIVWEKNRKASQSKICGRYK